MKSRDSFDIFFHKYRSEKEEVDKRKNDGYGRKQDVICGYIGHCA